MFSILPALVSFYFLVVGFLGLKNSSNRLLGRIFFSLCFLTFAWQVSWTVLFQIKNEEVSLFLIKLGWLFILFVPTVLYHFFVALVKKEDEMSRVYASYIFSSALLLLLVFSDMFVVGKYDYFFGSYPKAGVAHFLHITQTITVLLRGLYIAYQKYRSTNQYKVKLQIRYCMISLVVYMLAGIDYLCNYGIEIYPVGVIFITISLTIISYAIIKHQLLDTRFAISFFVARFVIYFCLVIITTAVGFLFDKGFLLNKTVNFSLLLLLLIVVCELYSFCIRQLDRVSKTIFVRQKSENKKRIDNLTSHLENSLLVDDLVQNINCFSRSVMNVELCAFYVRKNTNQQNIALSTQSTSYEDILIKDIKNDVFLNEDQINQMVNSRSIIESYEYPEVVLNIQENQILLPFVNANNLLGFALFLPKRTFSFWHYELFDLLLSRMGLMLDRALIYENMLFQNKQHLRDKADSLRALAASIAHELRNPLGVIQFAQSEIKNKLSQTDTDKEQLKKELTQLTNVVSDSIIQANQIIDIVLADLKEKPIDPADFKVLDVRRIVPDVVSKYGYTDESEKHKIGLALTHPFMFKAIPERFNFILYNLLKNALYYLNEYPKAMVTVGSESREINGVRYNSIYVHDTGPGIHPDVLPQLFGEFVSVGKKEGTGLGLAFCKRNMKVFGGDIVCESEFGSWSRFSLLFPEVPQSELILNQEQQNQNQKKILFVSGDLSLTLAVQKQLEESLSEIVCEIATNELEAKHLLQKNLYRLVLSNFEFVGVKGVVQIQWSKDTSNVLMCRTVRKYLFENHDNFEYLGDPKAYVEKLKGKRVLVADDQRLNRMFVSITLGNYGIEAVQASNGKELMELYQASLNELGESSFDLIITDINMPERNGDEVSRAIREQELGRGFGSGEAIPIIAMSGDGAVEDKLHFFESGMTDCFVKGTPPDVLVRLMAVYSRG